VIEEFGDCEGQERREPTNETLSLAVLAVNVYNNRLLEGQVRDEYM
jgi:hypothetical protein